MLSQQRRKRMEELLTGLHEIDVNIKSQQIPSKVILLMGQTKAGKTTLYYYLLGKKLIWEKNGLDVWQMRPEINYFIARIGNGYDSTTVYPNIPSEPSESGVMVIDMPGFDDSRHHFRLLNIYILLQVLKLTQNVHICLVIPEQCCQSDALMMEFQKFHQIFNQKALQQNKYLSFVVTKVQHPEIRQQFLNQVEDLIESQLISHLEGDLTAFKAKNIYQFHNSLPVIEEGMLLKQRIQNENEFYEVSRDPTTILSPSYCQEIIGRSNLQEFSDYLISVIEDNKHMVETLLDIYWNILFIEYNEVFIEVLQLKQGQQHSLQQYKEALASSSSKIPLYEFDKIAVKTHPRTQWRKEHLLNLLKCFEDIQGYSKDQGMIAKMLLRFGKNVSRFKNTSHLLDQEYLEKAQRFLLQTSNLLSTMQEIKLPPIADKLKEVTLNLQLIGKIERIFHFWKSHHKQILASPQFLKFRDLPQLAAAFGETLDDQTDQQIIKISIYGEARRSKQIKEILSKTKSKGQDGLHGLPQYLQGAIDVDPDHIDQSLEKMPVSRSSLRQLKDQYEIVKEGGQIWLIRKLLRKMSQIFYWFSFFQEAIVFRMATADESAIVDLFEEGTAFQQISGEFTRMVLIPYYSKINASITRLEMCYNYLFNLSTNPEEQCEVELERLLQLTALEAETDQCYLLGERYKPLELQYITRIMQSFETYLQQMEKKEAQFSRSPLAPLSGFINHTMKQ